MAGLIAPIIASQPGYHGTDITPLNLELTPCNHSPNLEQLIRGFTEYELNGARMDENIELLIGKLRNIEDQIEKQFEQRKANLEFEEENGKIFITEEIKSKHKKLKTGLVDYIRSANPVQIICAPFLYGLIVPLIFLDLSVSLYQQVCFRFWGLPLTDRANYIIFDHHHLGYINGIQKLNCMYCSYANGVIGLAREIAGKTEQYWCPIKHASRMLGAHDRYRIFLEYGDAEGFKRKSEEYRRRLKTASVEP